MACGRGHRAFAELLLARGADPGIRRHGGRTPLTIAAYNGHEPTLALLLRCCHDALEVADDERCTPLWYAARHGRTQALRLLLTAGADAWAAGEGDTLPLEVARSKGRLACVEALEVRGWVVCVWVGRGGEGRRGWGLTWS
jgi:ankyrin repeat protein